MSENSKPKSTVTLEDSIASIGGLILVMMFCTPLLILIGLGKAITLLTSETDKPTSRG